MRSPISALRPPFAIRPTKELRRCLAGISLHLIKMARRVGRHDVCSFPQGLTLERRQSEAVAPTSTTHGSVTTQRIGRLSVFRTGYAVEHPSAQSAIRASPS